MNLGKTRPIHPESAIQPGRVHQLTPLSTVGEGRSVWGLIRSAVVFLCLAGSGAWQRAHAQSPILFAGVPGELVLSEVGSNTVRVQFFPTDGENLRRPVPSTVLAPISTTERFRARTLEGEKELSLGALRIHIKAEPLTLTLRRDGKLVQELILDPQEGTNAAVSFRTTAPVLGLGEGAKQFDRRGALYPMEPSWGGWNRPVFGSVVPSPFVIGTDGWALFAHRPEGQFDLRNEIGRFIPHWTNGVVEAALDLFIISCKEPADALAGYTRLTGSAVMPPKWALGYFQSHRTLAGPEEPLEVARAFREKKLPCDAVIYLGTGYCTNGWNTGHGSLTFNTNAFVAENIRELHDLDFKVVFHVNRAPRNLFGSHVTEKSDSPLHIGNYWARHRGLIQTGVDGWWPDDGDELPLEARLARHRCYYEGSLLERPNLRPWSLHRTGYAGSQRYGGWIWSGDIDGKWETLAAQVSVGLNHGLSLTPFWGTDTGGFHPSRELTGELYVRWFQFSAFCPSFRSHGRTWHLRLPWGWNTGKLGPVEHPRAQHPDLSELNNPDVEPICRKYLELRYRMLPYNYTLAREAVDTGLPMMRAMWLRYPDDPEAVKLGDQYLWGRDLMVAPVIEKGAKVRRLYLPEGAWYDWWTGEKQSGKRWMEQPVDLSTLPLYARAGAIIPLDPVRQFTGESVTGSTTLRVFPGADGDFTLYDDDGQSLGYRDGSDSKSVWIRMRWEDNARKLTLEPDPRMKAWSGGSREFLVELAGRAGGPRQINFDGKVVHVDFR
jgi:alpha-glucosidase (family GH31 glycosyl hydrolase)